MRLVGFNFKKISAEKLKESTKELRFNTKIDISSIESLKSDLIKVKDEPVKIDFVYTVSYEPDFAKIELAGSMILSVEPKIAKEMLKGWKNKEMDEEVRIFIFNVILKKSNIKALALEDELNLPTHFPLPALNKSVSKEKKE